VSGTRWFVRNDQAFFRGAIPEVDGLRGIAILLVLLFHFIPDGTPVLSAISDYGGHGVDLFFVISGFLITGVLLDRRGRPHYFRDYWARRTLRIFPLYYLVVLLLFAVVPQLQQGAWSETATVQDLGSPWWYVLHVVNYRPAFSETFTQSWSLSVEEQFYVLIPVLVAVLSKRRVGWVLFAAAACAPLFRLLFLSLDQKQHAYFATPARMDGIALGCLLAVIVRSTRVLPSQRVFGVAFVVFAGTFACAFDPSMAFDDGYQSVLGFSLVALAMASLLMWALLGRSCWTTGWLRFPPLRFLGKICFALYLVHVPLNTLVIEPWLRPMLGIDELSAAFVTMAISVFIAALSWYGFERPILKLKSRFSGLTG
jgi:peptidoglycan/LPS O-acetylase OafA/YrhL